MKDTRTVVDRLYEARQFVEAAAIAYIHEPYPQREVSKLLSMLNTLDEMQKYRDIALEISAGGKDA